MGLKVLLKLVETILDTSPDDNLPRADMYLPKRLLAMAILFLTGGTVSVVYAFFKFSFLVIIGAFGGIIIGIMALLCWKNQKIHIISDDRFTYTTMFGKVRTYSFSDIEQVRRNPDSFTVFVGGEKVHIESMAVLSNRLAERINKAMYLNGKYLKMTAAELSQLSDEELFGAVWTRAESIVSSKDDIAEGFELLGEEQRIFYAVNYLEMEVNNGGICQYFVNSSRVTAPFVSEYMEKIGAFEHKELYDDFVHKYMIDTSDLSSFNCENEVDFQKQYERYPFDEYDDAFYKARPLSDYLMKFVKENIEKF